MIVVAYLTAIVAANLIVSQLGPSASVWTAFAFIGLNITARDRLHDRWRGNRLVYRMALLILTGSLLSWVLNRDVAMIAVASAFSFAVSEFADSAVYSRLMRHGWLRRVNGSNIASAAIDSVLFPLIAFGGFLPMITLGQFAAKVLGGAVWSVALRRRTLVVACFTLVAAPASAQTLSVGVGQYANDFVRQDVVEVVGLGPIGTSAIASFDLSADGKPVLLAQIGRTIVNSFPALLAVDVGASAGPWDDYGHWEPHTSIRAMAFLVGPLKAMAIYTVQPFADWQRGAVVKLDYTLW